MALKVIKAGLQTSLQGAPYSGQRHIGLPAAGAADSLSLALANRLVLKSSDKIALEITLDIASFSATQHCIVALTGAASYFQINGSNAPLHRSVALSIGDTIEIGPARHGCRSYLAIDSDIQADMLLGGQSTYLPAKLGGFKGRTLKAGDRLITTASCESDHIKVETPVHLRPSISEDLILRTTDGPEFVVLDELEQEKLFIAKWTASIRMNRIGGALKGARIQNKVNDLESAAVFPGTIQCPPDGQPYLLGPDAQTSGGYPRLAQVIRADRHLIGQIRPGSKIQLVKVTPKKAAEIYRQKLEILKPWLGRLKLW